ncbi:hypothetical protein [Adhaeretor mobilis]|uniref:Uncharacterized protein n=1 Tax=Adhaeretor mobilis TaxID=1930276 RepID=A0A517MX63_9BACT|nr:hypothetical protein [Adhaeretor mobilis]QDS99475.1 hypothetical protein HG15A2_27980 [Adhaeretor mobilis]
MTERGFEEEASDLFDQAVSDGKNMISIEPTDHDKSRLKKARQLIRDAGAEPLSLLEG